MRFTQNYKTSSMAVVFGTISSLFLACLAFAVYTGNLDADSIAKFISDNNIKSVDELLKQLPEGLRSQFSLVYDTRNAAQFASKEKPRVILFSPDGKFYLTFAGSPDVKGGNTVEMISQRANGTYSFSNIVFENGIATHNRNPAACVACHGKEPRPIWDGYPKWPGVYGSDHDVLRLDKSDFRHADDAKFESNSKELANLDVFRTTGLQEGRYANLVNVPTHENLQLYPHLSNMNMYLSEVLQDSTDRATIGKILDTPRVAEYLPWLLQQLGQNYGRDVYIINNQFDQFPGGNSAELIAEFRAFAKKRSEEFQQSSLKIRERLEVLDAGVHPKGFFDHFGQIDIDAFSLIEFVCQKAGIPLEAWAPGIQGNLRQAGGWPPGYITFHRQLVEQLMHRDPNLERFVTKKYYGSTFIYEISPEGYQYLKDNIAKFLGPKPLLFQETTNRHPPKKLSAISRCFSLFKLSR